MGKKPEITAVKIEKAPGRKVACKMLREIAQKPISIVPRIVDKPLVLYGAGNLGKMAKEYFDALGIPFLFVVDANPALYSRDAFWSGVDIFGIHDVPVPLKKSSLLAVCVALAPFTQVTAALMEQGWSDVVPFYDIAESYHDRHPLSNGWFSGILDEQDICQIDSVLYRWEDDISRAHHLQFIAWRSLREEWFFDEAPVTTNDRYFIPQILSVLHDHEVFVDVGAHYGEVIDRFIDAVKNQYGGIYAIEPDVENLSRLRAYLAQIPAPETEKLKLLTCALGSASGEKRFYRGLGYISQFSEIGQTQVDVKCLDDLLIPATFVKIHVEGWEGSVISGGLETIVQCRPILTVTSYHTRDGLWVLPAQMMSCLEDYEFHFRLHSWQDGCSVIYAVPRERRRIAMAVLHMMNSK